jgi:hypothetical protein
MNIPLKVLEAKAAANISMATIQLIAHLRDEVQLKGLPTSFGI